VKRLKKAQGQYQETYPRALTRLTSMISMSPIAEAMNSMTVQLAGCTHGWLGTVQGKDYPYYGLKVIL
jgi:hypothetical protein